MIDKNLEELSKFIHLLEQKDPNDVFRTKISEIQKKVDEFHEDVQGDQKKINESFDRFFSEIRHNHWPEELVILELYERLLSNLYRYMIYQKALELGVDPMLYKKEMGFLFKGKPLK